MNPRSCHCVALLGALFALTSADAALTHHYKLDETSGTTAVDSAGSLNATIGTGVTINQPGRDGTAFQFPAVAGNGTSRVTIPVGAPPATVAFTMTTFFNLSAAIANGGQAHLISANDGAAGRWNLGLFDSDLTIGVSAQLIWFHNGGLGQVDYGNTFNANSSVGDWVHVGITRDSAGLTTLYVNGTGVAVGTNSTLIKNVAIGLGERPNAAQFQLNGRMDDVRFYDEALSSTQMAELAAIPEPSVALLGISALGLSLLVRRRAN